MGEIKPKYNLEGKKYITEKFTKKKDYFKRDEDESRSYKNTLDKLIEEINPEAETFILELLQNADDHSEVNNQVYIDIIGDHLIFSHNGDKFSEDDVEGICSVGNNKKRAKKKTIGFKGMGFKSIFKYSNHVWINSGKFSFRFDEKHICNNHSPNYPWQIIPIWTTPSSLNEREAELLKSPVTIFIRAKREIINIKELEKIFISKFSKDSRFLLFLRNVNHLHFRGNSDVEFKINNKEWVRSALDLHPVSQDIQKRLNEKVAKDKTRVPDKFKDFKEVKITFATRIEDEKISKTNDARIFAYLPTSWNLGFKFLINSDFIPDGSRTDLFHDIPWNMDLAEICGEAFIDWILQLLNSYPSKDVYELLPDFDSLIDKLDFESTTTNEGKVNFLRRFKKGFYKKLLETKFIKCHDNSFYNLKDIIIDRTGLFRVFGINFFQSEISQNKILVHESIINETWISNIISELQTGLIYTWDDFTNDLGTNNKVISWLKKPKNNAPFLNHLFKEKKLEAFEEHKIFLDKNHSLKIGEKLIHKIKKADKKIFENIFVFDIIDPDVFNMIDSEIQNQILDFSKVNLNEFFEDEIISNFEDLNLKIQNTSNDDHFEYTSWILSTYVDNQDYFNENEKQSINSTLADLSIRTNSSTPVIAPIKNCFLPIEESEKKEIQQLLEVFTSYNVNYISSEYFSQSISGKSKFRKVLKSIGAQSTYIEFIQNQIIPKLNELNTENLLFATKLIFKERNRLPKNWKDSIDSFPVINSNNEIINASDSVTGTVYAPLNETVNNLEQLLDWDNIVSENYHENNISEWKDFFSEIGCKIESDDKVLNSCIENLIETEDISEEKHFESFGLLIKLNNKRLLQKEHCSKLYKLKLFCENDSEFKHNAEDIFLGTYYKPKINFQELLNELEELKFISRKYALNANDKKEVKSFLIRIGVIDGFTYKYKKSGSFADRKWGVTKDEQNQRTFIRLKSYGGYTYTPCVEITNIEIIKTKEINDLFWEQIMNDEDFRSKAFLRMTYKQFSDREFIMKGAATGYIINNKSIPNLDNDLCLPSDLYSNKLKELIKDQKKVAKIDLSQFKINGTETSIEEEIGIKTELCLIDLFEILKREESITFIRKHKITEKLLAILEDKNLNTEEKARIETYCNSGKIMNQLNEWVDISSIYTIEQSSTFDLGISNNQSVLHDDFIELKEIFQLRKLVESDFKFKHEERKIYRNFIKNRLKVTMKFLAQIIAPETYNEKRKELEKKIDRLETISCVSISMEYIEDEVKIIKSDYTFFEKKGNILYYIGSGVDLNAAELFVWICNYLEVKKEKNIFKNIYMMETEGEMIQFLKKSDYTIGEELEEDLSYDGAINQREIEEDKIAQDAIDQQEKDLDKMLQNEIDAEKKRKQLYGIEGETNTHEDDGEIKLRPLSNDQIEYLKSVITGDIDFGEEAQKDWNKNALFRCILHLKEKGLTLSDEGQNDLFARNEKIFQDADNREYTYFIRSAARGLLFIDPSTWEKMDKKESNRLIFYLGGEICEEVDSNEDLMEKYEVFNKNGLVRIREKPRVDDYNNLMQTTVENDFIDTKYDKYQFIFIVKETEDTKKFLDFLDIFKDDE